MTLRAAGASPRRGGPSRGDRIAPWDAAATILPLPWFVVALTLAVLQHETFHALSGDLGLYARSLWGIAYGYPVNSLSGEHVLAMEGHRILYLLAPLARALPAAQVLLVAQAAGGAASGVAAYVIAKRRLGSGAAAFALLLSVLFFPVSWNVVLASAQTTTLAAPLLMLGVDRLDRLGARSRGAWALLAVAFVCREETTLLVGALGLAWLTSAPTRRCGAAMALVGLGLFAIHAATTGDVGAALGWHGETSFALLRGERLCDRLSDLRCWQYLLVLVGSFGFLPLLGWRFAVPAILPAALGVLGPLADPLGPSSPWSYLVVPFFVLAAIEGLDRLRRRRPTALRPALVATLGCLALSYGEASHGPLGRRFDPERYAFTGEAQVTTACLNRIPATAQVMAPARLTAHLAERPVVVSRLSIPTEVDQLDYVLLEKRLTRWIGDTPAHRREVALRLEDRAMIELDYEFRAVSECGPYVLLAAPAPQRGSIRRPRAAASPSPRR